MTLLMYAISRPARSAVQPQGLGGVPLTSIRYRDLAAIVGQVKEAEQRVSVERLWDYERVIEALADQQPVLPVRFGTRFRDDADVRAFLEERHDELAATLETVSGAVELSVTARWLAAGPDPAVAPPGSGTAYMRRLVQRRRRTDALLGRLNTLAAVARASRMRPGDANTDVVVGAFLVEPERVDEFTRHVAEVAGALEHAEVVCTGPWPPYSFAEAGRW